MVNGILGAGVLGYPFAFRSCGLIAAAGLVLLCLAACQLSMRFLLLSRSASGNCEAAPDRVVSLHHRLPRPHVCAGQRHSVLCQLSMSYSAARQVGKHVPQGSIGSSHGRQPIECDDRCRAVSPLHATDDSDPWFGGALPCSQLTGRRTYEELALYAFGRPGRQTITSSIFVMNMGASSGQIASTPSMEPRSHRVAQPCRAVTALRASAPFQSVLPKHTACMVSWTQTHRQSGTL